MSPSGQASPNATFANSTNKQDSKTRYLIQHMQMYHDHDNVMLVQIGIWGIFSPGFKKNIIIIHKAGWTYTMRSCSLIIVSLPYKYFSLVQGHYFLWPYRWYLTTATLILGERSPWVLVQCIADNCVFCDITHLKHVQTHCSTLKVELLLVPLKTLHPTALPNNIAFSARINTRHSCNTPHNWKSNALVRIRTSWP